MAHQEDYRSQLMRRRYQNRAGWYGQPTQAEHERALGSVALFSLIWKYLAPAASADAKRQSQRPAAIYIPAIHGTEEELERYRHSLALLGAWQRALSRLPSLRSRSRR